jgi:hypothetical protein
MANFYVDRMLDKHMKGIPSFERGNRPNHMEKYQLMDDKQLMDTAKKAIRGKGYNNSFLTTAEKILSFPPISLSEKQRSCFLGLLNVQGDKTNYLQGLTNQELLDLSQQAVHEQLFNEDFEAFGKKIVNDRPKALSQKQINGLLGLLNW